MKITLLPAGILYSLVTGLRNRGFDWGILKTKSVGCPVVAVGNLTAGGTGKTPLIAHILEYLSSRGLKAGVVSRGYKGDFTGVARVPAVPGGVYFGDEPMMLATRFPQVPVFVGGDRVQAAEALLRHSQVQLILADDAFQHRWLKRDLDVVVIDATQPLDSYRPLPWGLARESATSLHRADFVVLSKVNLVEPRDLAKVRQLLKGQLAGASAQVIEAAYAVTAVQALKESEEPFKVQPGMAVFLLSAIGRPQGFERLVRSELPVEIIGERHFADHHYFTNADLEKLSGEVPDGTPILVTEKDSVKLKQLRHPLLEHMYVVKMQIRPGEGIEGLYEAILRNAR